jgi:hypothetical protein
MLAYVLGQLEGRCAELRDFVKDCQRSGDHKNVYAYKIAKDEMDRMRLHVEALWKTQAARHKEKESANG